MKKQRLKILVLCVFCMSSLTTYSAVTLPVNYTKFFAGTAVNSNGTDLEVGSTAATNTWYLAGTANGVSPTISTNDLTYSNYVDNSAGKKITLSSSTSAIRTSFYQFTGAAADLPGGGTTYYVSFILNVSAAPSGYVLLANFINGTTGGGARGRIQIKASTTANNFQIQTLVSASGSPSIGPLAYNTNHLIVLKYEMTTASSPAGTANGAATTTLFANPTLGAAEPASTATITESNISNLDCIKALVINQQPGLGAQIAGLRFSNNWSDVTPSSTATKLENVSSGKLIVTRNIIIAPETGNFEVYNMQGIRLLNVQNQKEIQLSQMQGVYVVRFTAKSGESEVKRLILR